MKEWRKTILGLGAILAMAGLASWIAGPWHPEIHWGQFTRDLKFKLGLDLQGGAHLIYRAKVDGVGDDQVTDAIAGVRDVIERRVNSFGVSEPLVQTNKVGDEHRVIVELAGVFDPAEAIKLIGQTPQLDFRREVVAEEALQQFNIDDPSAITGPVFERTELSGRHLQRATVSFDQLTGTPQVNLEFNSEGQNLFAELTRENINKRIAIYLDEVPISAPVVQAEITNGQAVISGGFSVPEAKELVQNLNAGALPIPIELISQKTVGPALGKASIDKSMMAGLVGMAAVMIFMLVFYRLLGLVAAVALGLYAIFFLALIKLMPITLTVAGIAGFILSIGMAVDANVLIFERLKENLRANKPVLTAVRQGFQEAWSSILVSNVSSLLIAVILYGFGTSIVRGFALTFAIGILVSMFTAVTVTRLLTQAVLQGKFLQRPFLLAVKKVNYDS